MVKSNRFGGILKCALALLYIALSNKPLNAISEKARRVKEWRGEIKHHKLPPAFDAAADGVFYHQIYRPQVIPVLPSDDQLRRDSNIQHYPFNARVTEAEEKMLHVTFAKKRVRAKRYPAHQGGTEQHPDITELAVVFIQNQADFLEDFVHFLKALCRVEFYSNLARRAVDLSRPLGGGDPTLNAQLRQQNERFVNTQDQECERLYAPIQGYLDYVNNCCRNDQVAEYYKDWKRQHHRP